MKRLAAACVDTDGLEGDLRIDEALVLRRCARSWHRIMAEVTPGPSVCLELPLCFIAA